MTQRLSSPLRNVAALLKRNEEWLLAFYRRSLRQKADVADLMQDMFLRLTRTTQIEAIEHERAFLAKVARSTLIDYQRRHSVRLTDHHQELSEEVADPGFAADRVLESRQIAEEVATALATLPERSRDVFVLRTIKGLRMAEVADTMGISLSTAEKHHARALAILTTLLAGKFR